MHHVEFPILPNRNTYMTCVEPTFVGDYGYDITSLDVGQFVLVSIK